MKNRVRMIVVLVCVFVVLPVVGGLVYSFSVSAETGVFNCLCIRLLFERIDA